MISNICIIEDSVVERKILKSILKDPIFKYFENPKQFLEYLDANKNIKIDLIITDNIQPFYTGLELAKILRVNYKLYFLPIILLSGINFELPDNIYTYINSFVLKPSNISEYKVILENIINYWTNINIRIPTL